MRAVTHSQWRNPFVFGEKRFFFLVMLGLCFKLRRFDTDQKNNLAIKEIAAGQTRLVRRATTGPLII
jgi:hypothetical protein